MAASRRADFAERGSPCNDGIFAGKCKGVDRLSRGKDALCGSHAKLGAENRLEYCVQC